MLWVVKDTVFTRIYGKLILLSRCIVCVGDVIYYDSHFFSLLIITIFYDINLVQKYSISTYELQ